MRPLEGLRVVITRAAHQSKDLADRLRELGAEPVFLPLIEIALPEDPTPLREAARNVNHYDWIVFTSANAVRAFAAELPCAEEVTKPQIAAVGPATREAAEQSGLRVQLMPEKYVGEALAKAFDGHDLSGKRILIPRAAVARDVVPNELKKYGAEVEVVEAYRNIIPQNVSEKAKHLFQNPYPEWLTFASSSAVDHLVQILGPETLKHCRIATIGPVTSETVRHHGLNIAAEAPTYSVEGLVNAIVQTVQRPA